MEALEQWLKQKYDIQFHNKQWLKEAFTHSSYVNENRREKVKCNERLEYLGDAVLELLVSDYLFREYPNMPEGKMTRHRASIVKEDSLAYFARQCQFDKYIRLGKGEDKAGGRQRPALLCDLFEAFLGALYMDQGVEAVSRFLNIVMFPKVKEGSFESAEDYKTRLQEKLQKNGDIKIEYRLVSEEGPAHHRTFVMAVYANGEFIAQGNGRSKKQAEQAAAKAAYQK